MPRLQPPRTKTMPVKKRKYRGDHCRKRTGKPFKITRALGCQYIWIDSLCIIQEDEVDFNIQTSKMGSIYEMAFLVIAADVAENTEAGFLTERGNASHRIDVPWEGSRSEDLEIFSEEDLPSDVSYHDGFYSVGDAGQAGRRSNPVFSRAWCLQERLLATRIVHYTKWEMIWECRSRTTCECGRLDVNDPDRDQPILLQCYFDRAKSSEGAPAHSESGAMFWRSTVQRFSKCKITRPRDRLPAISGLARQIQLEKLGSYCAGLWEQELPVDLLWRRDEGSKHDRNFHSRYDEYIAPTWSWVSLNGPVTHPSLPKRNMEAVAKVLNVSCEHSGRDEFGALVSGSITLEAPALLCSDRNRQAGQDPRPACRPTWQLAIPRII
jgi:hypothetical protein